MVLLLHCYVSSVLSSIVISSLGEEGAGLLLAVLCFSAFPLSAGGGLQSLSVALPEDYFMVSFSGLMQTLKTKQKKFALFQLHHDSGSGAHKSLHGKILEIQ